MSTWLQLLILVLATYRITRLVIEDEILEPLRERTVYRLHPQSKLRALLDCPWCLGLWLSGAAVALYWWNPELITWIGLPFAISTVIGLIASHED